MTRTPDRPQPSRQRRWCSVAGIVVGAVLTLLLIAGPAGAHTGFASSTPPDGETVTEPVEQIVLTFTGPAEPSGRGFEVLDPQGTPVTPEAVADADRKVWTLTFDEPLAGGPVGVRWMVQAPDAHPIDGSFSFTVEAPAADPAGSTSGMGAESSESSMGPEALASFLTANDTSTAAAERVAAVGRVLGIGGTLLGVGALVFAATVLRGNPRDVRHVLFWVRRAGVLIVVGAVVRMAGRVAIDAGGDWGALTSPSAIWATAQTSTGLAILLRLAGGVLLAAGCRLQLASAQGRPDPVVQVGRLVGAGDPAVATAGADSAPQRSTDLGDRPGDVVWAPGSGSVATWVGAAVLLVGYLFDGHTVTEGNLALTAASDLVHVLAAAVWVGGVLMVASVLRQRHRAGASLRALHLAVRFSVVAVVALVAVAASGLALAWIVLDAPSELWTTPWGRLLMAKTALVAVAAGIGGYNHRVLIPAMEAAPPDSPAAQRFRGTIAVEAGVLCAVVVVTAFLVGAAS